MLTERIERGLSGVVEMAAVGNLCGPEGWKQRGQTGIINIQNVKEGPPCRIKTLTYE